MITTLTRRLKLLESQQNDRKMTLENTQQKLQDLSKKASDTSLHCQALEDKNQALNSLVMELSSKVGQLQAREQELLTVLKLKDNDILEASNHISEFMCKFKKLENALRAARMEEANVNKEKQDFIVRVKQLTLETNRLKSDLSEKTKESNEKREEIIRLKQENGFLNNELLLSAERANRRDQLLQSAKSKQRRTDTELSNLRQIYVKQQRDLQFLHFSMESSQEIKQKPKPEVQETSREMVLSDLKISSDRDTVCSEISQKMHTGLLYVPSSSSKNISQICKAKSKQQTGLEERQPASLGQLQEGLFHGQRTAKEASKQSSLLNAGETDRRPAAHSESPWKPEGKEMSQAVEPNCDTSLLNQHCLELNSCVELANCQNCKRRLCNKSHGDCKDMETDTAGIQCGQNPNKPLSSVTSLELGCCSCNFLSKAAPYQPGGDMKWMQIFRPVKGGGGAFSSCPLAAHGIRSDKSKSDHDVGLKFSDLDAPCLTSTQKTSESDGHEKFFNTEFPLQLMNVTDDQAANGCGHPTISHDSCSPSSKLQRLLAESQQMVADLELTNLLGASPFCSPKSSQHEVTEYTDSLCKVRLPEEKSKTKLSLHSL
ncbi:coiled-coil domain-containing protein 62 isoform X2 [Sceloporus undulatus]|nr:coiled-coil domain-containing protein 62 isoform X2 [Sceloporus undulatus]XP_042297965.1 coiled-coil domain-containing protein 62 isoform X2 [Sceloporus undulatus]